MLVADHQVAKRAWRARGEEMVVVNMWEGPVDLVVVMMELWISDSMDLVEMSEPLGESKGTGKPTISCKTWIIL